MVGTTANTCTYSLWNHPALSTATTVYDINFDPGSGTSSTYGNLLWNNLYTLPFNYNCTTNSVSTPQINNDLTYLPTRKLTYIPANIVQGLYVTYDYTVPLSQKYAKQARIRSNLSPIVKSRASSIDKAFLDREHLALETLRELISEEEYRRYLKYGFVIITGASGDQYQIFRDRSHTKVWRKGQLVEEVCLRLSDDKIPSTDKVLTLKTMIEADEEQEFLKAGNRYRMKVRV
jgi:hypothetical protein